MEEVQHIAFIPIDSHTEFYFPPARLLWPSADYQIVQTVRRPEAFAASGLTKRTQNICMKKNIRILHIAKKTFLLHSLTSYLGPIFLAIRSIHLQMREANLPVSYLEPVFYYPYSLPLLRVNRELENSVSMVR